MLAKRCIGLICATVMLAATAEAKSIPGLEPGSIELTSAGPIAFAPDGVLLVSDPMAAAIYAVATGETSGDPSAEISVDDLKGKIASMLGSDAQDIRIADLAVNPASGNVYLSVARGSGPDAAAVLLWVNSDGKISEFRLVDVDHAKASLPNAPASAEGRRGDPRMMTVTDLAYIDGRVFIAGLSNEEFASKLRAIPFPFTNAGEGTSVEIYHGAHGQVETRSPIMTFAAYDIGSEPHVLAAYTCTPLVKFRVDDLVPGTKVSGETVAELGNRNRPLDMFIYERDGKNYVLMANSSRGVMKITTENIADVDPIEEPVRGGGIAGLEYDTIQELQGVLQLDRLNEDSAVALIQSADGSEDLRTIALP